MQLKLNETNRVKEYFTAGIRKRKKMNKILSKYIVAFDDIEKTLLVLSASSLSVPVASFAIVIGAPVRLISTSISFLFSIGGGIAKKTFKNKEEKRKINTKRLFY